MCPRAHHPAAFAREAFALDLPGHPSIASGILRRSKRAPGISEATMYSWTRKMGKRMPSEFGEQISLTWRNHANNESIIQPGPLALALLPRCLGGTALKPGPWLAHGSWLMAHAAVSSSRTALNRGCDSTRAGDCQGMPMAPTKVCTQLMNGAPLPLLPACLSQIPRPCLGYPWLHFWSHPPPHCWLQIACLQPST